MSNTSSFYVTLPSNGSKRFFPDNTAGVFRNNLAQPLELEGQWEMALVEMEYPITWKLLTKENKVGVAYFHKDTFGMIKPEKRKAQFTMGPPEVTYGFPLSKDITHSDNFSLEDLRLGMDAFHLGRADLYQKVPSEVTYILIPLSEGRSMQVFLNINSIIKSMDYVEISIPTKYYHTPAQVARTMAEELRKEITAKTKIDEHVPEDTVDLQYFSVGAFYQSEYSIFQFFSDLPDSICGFVMYQSCEELYRLLGLEPPAKAVVLRQFPFDSFSVRPLMRFNTPALYVYTDIVADELVGDAKVPLLRTVPIRGQMGEFEHIEFRRPYYKPLTKGYISSILIEVKDDTGKDIEFTLGKVICKLHFRRCGLAV